MKIRIFTKHKNDTTSWKLFYKNYGQVKWISFFRILIQI